MLAKPTRLSKINLLFDCSNFEFERTKKYTNILTSKVISLKPRFPVWLNIRLKIFVTINNSDTVNISLFKLTFLSKFNTNSKKTPVDKAIIALGWLTLLKIRLIPNIMTVINGINLNLNMFYVDIIYEIMIAYFR